MHAPSVALHAAVVKQPAQAQQDPLLPPIAYQHWAISLSKVGEHCLWSVSTGPE